MPGLTSEEARRRLVEHGRNEVADVAGASSLRQVVEQVTDPLVLVLIGASLLTSVTGDWPDTLVIALVIVVNTTVGVLQHRRAERAVAELKRLAPQRATVLRDGDAVLVPAVEVVPGDVALVAAGDILCADGLVETSESLMLDESTMTGESLPVDRAPAEVVRSGTLVVRGRGTIDVTLTGAHSALGQVAQMVRDAPARLTPLQRRMHRLGLALVVLVLALCGLVVALGLLRGSPSSRCWWSAPAWPSRRCPSLPAVVTVALALGAHRMANRNAVVRSLSAVETLGSVSVVATDKTGTLTHGSLAVAHTWTPADDPCAQRRLLRDVVLCNDADHAFDDGSGPRGEPLEVALLDHAAASGLDVTRVRDTWPRTSELPFDASTQQMQTCHRGDGSDLVVLKGSPERMFAQVDGDTAVAARVAEEWAAQGSRVLAVADREPGPGASSRLTLAGLVAFADPPRSAAAPVIARLRAAGIRVVLVTGDHVLTARSVARQVGIPDRAADPSTPADASVFARVTPRQKLVLVSALQEEGEVVAMLGDGVNDAPALKRSDVGVAAGRTGTEVARQAADLVLLDDDLSTVAAAVEEGRRIFDNLRAFLVYAVSGGLSEVAVMMLGPAVGMNLPLLPAQILWINLLTHGLTGVAFSGEPAAPDVMQRPPVPRSTGVLQAGHYVQLAVAAATLSLSTLLVGLVVDHHPRTAVFVALGLGQLGVALALRSRAPLRASYRLLIALLASSALMVVPLAGGPLGQLLSVSHLRPADAAIAVAAAAVPGLVVAAVRRARTSSPRRLPLG
ncbi:MAG: cation-translocating P-type ATPase [Nocardioides sp.]